jgi:hypothetical protein
LLDSLAVSGNPGDVDALLDRLIASPTMLDVQSSALFAGVSKEAATGNAPDDTTTRPPSAADAPAAPLRVRLRVEVVEPEAHPVSEEQPVAESTS